jgi:nitric oxide reductase NorE protein
LAGDLAVWLIILAELLAFGILILSYAFARTFDVALFNASQRTLDLNSGAINTALLITESGCVVCAVQAVQQDASAAGARWLLAALACGAGMPHLRSLFCQGCGCGHRLHGLAPMRPRCGAICCLASWLLSST